MVKKKPEWHAMLPGRTVPSAYTLDELRSAKQAHEFLTEPIPGPPGIASHIRGFRYLLFFGIACVVENKYPPLTRCWKDLDRLFMSDRTFDDVMVVQAWIMMDFPFGPQHQTAVDYFEEFLKDTEVGPQFQEFIDETRRSRLGLYQDVMRTKHVAKFRELISGRVIEAFPSVEQYGKGEILLVRTMTAGNQVYLFGNPKGFPKEAKAQIEDMVIGKLFYFDDKPTPIEQYEAFMKLAGPYWMSCVTQNDAVPILEPDHYLTYLPEEE